MLGKKINFFDIGCYYLFQYNKQWSIAWYTSGDNKICFSTDGKKSSVALYLEKQNYEFDIEWFPENERDCVTKIELAKCLEPEKDPLETIQKYEL